MHKAKSLGVNVIYTRDIGVALLAAIFKWSVIYEAHKDPQGFFAKLIFSLTARFNCVRFVTISEALSTFYQLKYHVEKNRIHVAHDGVFIEKYDRLRSINKSIIRKSIGINFEKKIIMHTGSLYSGRGAEYFEVLLQNFPNILFVQVGGFPRDIEKWKKRYHCYDNIIFVDHVENSTLIKYQMCADLLFFPMTKSTPTWWCCSPMKIFEYMATGTPILSVNIGSLGEILSEDNCIIFDTANPTSINDGVLRFLKNENNASQKANRALDHIRKKYTWKKRAQSICGFIIS
jgi:glycosyltransferase involved in cell wall biosynthesis